MYAKYKLLLPRTKIKREKKEEEESGVLHGSKI